MRSKNTKLNSAEAGIIQNQPVLPPPDNSSEQQLLVPNDAVVFARDFFGFNAKEYQAGLLRDKSKRIVVRWSRQAGKTTCIALRAIWFASVYPKTVTLVVAPTLASKHDNE